MAVPRTSLRVHPETIRVMLLVVNVNRNDGCRISLQPAYPSTGLNTPYKETARIPLRTLYTLLSAPTSLRNVGRVVL